jgi:hypothetical protein
LIYAESHWCFVHAAVGLFAVEGGALARLVAGLPSLPFGDFQASRRSKKFKFVFSGLHPTSNQSINASDAVGYGMERQKQ